MTRAFFSLSALCYNNYILSDASWYFAIKTRCLLSFFSISHPCRTAQHFRRYFHVRVAPLLFRIRRFELGQPQRCCVFRAMSSPFLAHTAHQRRASMMRYSGFAARERIRLGQQCFRPPILRHRPRAAAPARRRQAADYCCGRFSAVVANAMHDTPHISTLLSFLYPAASGAPLRRAEGAARARRGKPLISDDAERESATARLFRFL